MMISMDLDMLTRAMHLLHSIPPRHAGEEREIAIPRHFRPMPEGSAVRDLYETFHVMAVVTPGGTLGWKIPEMVIDFGHAKREEALRAYSFDL